MSQLYVKRIPANEGYVLCDSEGVTLPGQTSIQMITKPFGEYIVKVELVLHNLPEWRR